MSVYIVYSPWNLIGGGSDPHIRGVYFSFEEAKKSAQDSVDLDTFQDWLDIEIKYPYRYATGDREISYLRTLEIMEVPPGTPIDQEMISIASVEATYDNPMIQNHPKFDEYREKYEYHIIQNVTVNEYRKMFFMRTNKK